MSKYITYAVGEEGKILVRRNHQGPFIDKSINSGIHIMDVQSFKDDGERAVICGISSHSGYHNILYTTDGGDTWNPSSGGNAIDYYKLWITEDNTVWVAGNGSIVSRSIDGGISYDNFLVSSSNTFRAIHALDSNVCIVGTANLSFADVLIEDFVGSGGGDPKDIELYLTTDGGQSWTKIADNTNIPLDSRVEQEGIVGVHIDETLQNIIVQTMYSVFKSNDGGNTWIEVLNSLDKFSELPKTYFMRKMSWFPAYGVKDYFMFHSWGSASGFMVKSEDLNNFDQLFSPVVIRSSDINMHTLQKGYVLGEYTY